MARPLRIQFPHAYYHIMNRGLARLVVFADRADRTMFLALLADCHGMWGVRVIAYCLLGTHYHLLMQTPQANLSRVMRHLDGVYTQRYNRRHRRDGPLFRGRYKAIVIDAEAYLLAVARYIHQNPVAAGLVKSPEAYAWSSCRLYVDEGTPPEWLDAGQLLNRFPQKDRSRAFLAFMRSQEQDSVKLFYQGKRWLPVLGSDDFHERLRREVKKRHAGFAEVPEAKPYLQPDASACLEAVGRVYGRKREELLRGRRGQRNEARAVAMYVCRRLAGMKLDDIAKLFSVGGYSGVSSVIGRVREGLERRGEMARRFEQIQSRLKR